ncbi:hypothetical protein C3L33_05570, partial [Rhododendron williamsianum]
MGSSNWVATVALGKLSDIQGDREKSNVLWAIWAPMLLLHLGGPDSITAYSLEDNQLWLRHLMGLVVQLSVAIYVILMSWKNSWFSFMSLPALVAGVIKYGERTWVLMSVSGDRYIHRIPLGDLGEKYSTEGHDYVRALVVAHHHLRKFMEYLELEGSSSHESFDHRGDIWGIFWDALEVQMGLMYDLLYTKAAVLYSTRSFIMRCISFGCTVTVLVGLTIHIVLLKTKEEDDEDNWHEIDIAITGVLMTDAPSPARKIIRVVFGRKYEEKWNRYQHMTAYSIHPLVYNAILGLSDPNIDSRMSGSLTGELDHRICALLDFSNDTGDDFSSLITRVHLVTEICYCLETEWDAAGSDDPSGSDSSTWKENREVSKALSNYMMYLVIMQPSLLPNVGSLTGLEMNLKDPKRFIGNDARDIKTVCRYLQENSNDKRSLIVQHLRGKEKAKRWEIIKLTWLQMLLTQLAVKMVLARKTDTCSN